MPRTRKPQVARPAGRVASTTTWATKNVPSPMVYRIPTGRRDYSCEWQIVGSWEAPIHVRWRDEHEFLVTLNEAELKNDIQNYESLDLSNVDVKLGNVEGPVSVDWNVTVDGKITATEWEITTLTSTTGTIDTLTSTDATITNVTATDVSTGTLEASSDATVGWTLWVTGDATLGANLSVEWDSSITGNETITGTLDVTWATTVTELTASTSVTTEDLTVNGETTVWAVTAWATTVDSLDVTNWATVWTTLDVTGDSTFGWDVDVTGNASITGTADFTGDVTTVNVTSTGTATLNDVNVGWNEAVSWTLSVTWNTTLNAALTVAGAATLSNNAAVGWNLSVAWNQTVTWTSTTTWNAIFNSDVTVAGNESVTGNETITGTLSVGDDVTLSEDLTVNWTTSIKALETDGSVDIDGTLRVTWAINGSNWATIDGQVESDTVRTWEVIADEVRVSTGLYLSNNAEAPDFILQVEKWQPGGVAVLGVDGKVPAAQLPAVFTTCILKIVEVVFDNSTTAVLRDPDIMLAWSQWLSNYQDIVWDIDPTIHEGEIILVSNEVETGSVHVNIAYPVDRCAQLAQNNQSWASTQPVADADLSGSDPLP